MTNTYLVHHFFTETALQAMGRIFHQAHRCSPESIEERALNLRLLEILQKDRHRNQRMINTSPNGKNHVVVSLGACMLINIFGVVLIFDSPLYFEGDISIQNIRWIENDHLLLLDAYNIPNGETETYICHYSNDDHAFVYYTPVKCTSNEITVYEEYFGQTPPIPQSITISI